MTVQTKPEFEKWMASQTGSALGGGAQTAAADTTLPASVGAPAASRQPAGRLAGGEPAGKAAGAPGCRRSRLLALHAQRCLYNRAPL